MKGQSLSCHSASFIQGAARGDNAWNIWKRNAIIAGGVLMDEGDVVSHLGFSRASLAPFHILHSFSFRLACFSMLLSVLIGTSLLGCGTVTRPRLGWMLELDVATLLGDLLPTHSSRHSGANVDCPRSAPSTKRFMNCPPANRPANHSRQLVFTQPGPFSEVVNILDNVRSTLPAQPVDATQALNLSAGVSNCK